MGLRLVFRASRWNVPELQLVPSRLGDESVLSREYVVGLGINTLLMPCGTLSQLLQRHSRVFAFRSCGPGSIPTSGG